MSLARFDIDDIRVFSQTGSVYFELTSGDGVTLDSPQLVIFQEDEIEYHWQASVGLALDQGSWKGSFTLNETTEPKIFRITSILGPDQKSLADLGDDLIYLEPTSDGEWITGDHAKTELTRILQLRDAAYRKTFSAPDGCPNCNTYVAVALADNLLLTNYQRVPGMYAAPVTELTLGSDVREVLNSLLQQSGFSSGIPEDEWFSQLRSRKHATALVIPEVRAMNGEEAYRLVLNPFYQFANLLGFRRNASPNILGGVIGKHEVDGSIQYQGCWTTAQSYRGNLLGGFASGEDQRGLLKQWADLNSSPRGQLWLDLLQEAKRVVRWDQGCFRFESLLEAMAAEHFSTDVVVTNSTGLPRIRDVQGNIPWNTSKARGGIYQLLAEPYRASGYSENMMTPRLTSTQTQSELWDEVGLWVDIRNEVAHEGGWEVLSTTQDPQHQKIYDRLLDRSPDGTFDGGVNSTMLALRSYAESAVGAAIRGEI